MSVLIAEGRMRMFHDRDPRDVIMEKVAEQGGLDKLELFANNILVAIYRRPEKTKSGLYLGDKTRGEDLWQGSVGLVLKKGPLAYVDDEDVKFYGQNVEIGDWVWFRPQESLHKEVNGIQCRVMKEHAILGKIPDPDYVW